ncbi:glycosyltransferase [Actinoplanes sp. NPDC051851]|uniref:glycosyltransferase n=1 Tax=Actinoplanes sp. NPDC051851 TaxID=3154753 RepID=UPI0034165263
MKILFVAPWIPSRYRPRSLEFLEILAAEHEVALLALTHDEAEIEEAAALPVTDQTLVPNSRVGTMTRSLRSLVTGESLQTGYANPPELVTALRAKIAEWRPDVVHLNVFRTAHLVEACGDTPVLIDLDEFRSEYYEQLAADGPNPAWRAIGRVEQHRMRAREDELVRARVPIILSAPGDTRPGTYVVRSICDFPLQPHTATAPTVLFVGRLSYEANVEGLMWFAREVWPGIKQAVPDARLRIVGQDPPKSVKTLAEQDGVDLFANVPSIEPHYGASTVAIAPIFRGTGIQMKLIQALSAGVPTVTSEMVAARAGVRDGEQVRTAEDPQGWVAAIGALLRDRAERERLAVNGREWAVANHGSAAVRGQLDVAYAAVTGHRSVGSDATAYIDEYGQ